MSHSLHTCQPCRCYQRLKKQQVLEQFSNKNATSRYYLDKIIKHFLCLSRGKFLRVFFSPDSELYCAFFSIAITENNSTDFRGRFHIYAIKSEILNQHMDMLHVRRAWLV